ncbi:MAG: JAB domain-containing protein [Lachnospiraceae bacterium]|nr:JAB domain-containing protein [Lachnospiraceae bacterium]
MNYTIKDLPENERPVEKFLLKGESALSDAELLAIIIRTGTKDLSALALADKLLKVSQGILGIHHLSVEELTSVKGIGKVKAIQLKAIGELSKRIARSMATQTEFSFVSPEAIADRYMEDLRHLEQEQLMVLYLNTKCNLIKEEIITKGTVNMSIVSPREIFINAVKYKAVSLILLHNHPSGDPTPSRHDIEATYKVKEAGELIGISLIDHIIIGDNRYVSLKRDGLL